MSIDVQICAYYQLHGQGQNMVDSRGTVYAKTCASCDFRIRNWKEDGQLWVCGHCGEKWESEEHEIIKGHVARRSRTTGKRCHTIPAPRAGEYEDRVVGLAHFGYHLNQMLRDGYWRFPTQVLVGFALTSCLYENIAEHANQYGWPTPRMERNAWSATRCEWWAGRARGELRRRLSSTKSTT